MPSLESTCHHHYKDDYLHHQPLFWAAEELETLVSLSLLKCLGGWKFQRAHDRYTLTGTWMRNHMEFSGVMMAWLMIPRNNAGKWRWFHSISNIGWLMVWWTVIFAVYLQCTSNLIRIFSSPQEEIFFFSSKSGKSFLLFLAFPIHFICIIRYSVDANVRQKEHFKDWHDDGGRERERKDEFKNGKLFPCQKSPDFSIKYTLYYTRI